MTVPPLAHHAKGAGECDLLQVLGSGLPSSLRICHGQHRRPSANLGRSVVLHRLTTSVRRSHAADSCPS